MRDPGRVATYSNESLLHSASYNAPCLAGITRGYPLYLYGVGVSASEIGVRFTEGYTAYP